MSKLLPMFAVACVLGAGSHFVTSVQAEDRPAEKILADIKAVKLPPSPKDRNDKEAVQAFLSQRQEAANRKADLIGELLKAHPESPELPSLVLERWQAVLEPGPKAEAMNSEIESVIATSKNEKLVAEAAFVRGFVAFRKAGQEADASTLLPIAEAFISKAPKDPRGAMFLGAVVSKTTDATKLAELNKRIEKDYPDSPIVKQMAAERRLKDAVGKPFKIEFTEAFKGTPISMATLKGKVVIVDFWATWCGPCVSEMPKMKELYAKYKDKGVEFIGVSLDQPKEAGGYDALKSFVEKNKIEWPQYYQADGSVSEFATTWGINAIPTVFAVDSEGNLATLDARGKLETLIPELLQKAEKAKTAAAKP